MKLKEFYGKVKAMDRARRAPLLLACCAVFMVIGVLAGLWVQTAGGKVRTSDLRKQSNSGTITLKATDKDAPANYTVRGDVQSGVLFVPKKATAANPAPAAVFIHGLYNNREMQEQNAIEAARRGYVVLEIDAKAHGHNTAGTSSMSGFDGTNLLGAAKYLYNLPFVDGSKILVSGHSMGGGETNNALRQDGIDTSYSVSSNGVSTSYVGQTDASLKAGYHMGIISAGIVQANNPNVSYYGSNLLGVGNIKASSDEFFYTATLKEAEYIAVNQNTPTIFNYTNYYVKKGNEFVKVTAEDKFNRNTQYYSLTTSGGAINFLRSRQAVLFTGQAKNNNEAAALEKWETINGGIYNYKTGELIAQPNGKKLVSVANRGAAIAKRDAEGNVTVSIRAQYEAKETHPMNHFSKKSAAHIIDFMYNVFGVAGTAKGFKAPTNQTWLLKEVFSIFGFIGLFGMLLGLLDLLLETKTFGSLKAKEEEFEEEPVLLTNPRKHVFYWGSGILTAWFGAYSLSRISSTSPIELIGGTSGNWASSLGSSTIFAASEGYILANIGTIAIWSVICGLFALAVTFFCYGLNTVINAVVYREHALEKGEHPFRGFRIRSFENMVKTPILALVLFAAFYGVIFLIWHTVNVDFRFWTFDLRVFNLDRLAIYFKYAKWFFVYYLVNAALCINYRTKDLPEWATICINVALNVGALIILLGRHNAYFIRTGASLHGGNNLFYIACYPVIPCIAIATVMSRRIYKRTGNGWLAGLLMAAIMTTIACANTSINGTISWVYPIAA